MTALLIDTSVLVKWFHSAGEAQVAAARAVLQAHIDERLEAFVLDLGVYELGNVLLRSLHWSPGDVADQLADLLAICGPPVPCEPAWLREAAALGAAHGLTFYDAAWAAAAQGMQVSLVSMDKRLLGAALAESPDAVASRLRLVVAD